MKNRLRSCRVVFTVLAALFVQSALAERGGVETGVFEHAQNSAKARQPHIQVALLAERPDSETGAYRVGVLFQPDPGWHIYWRNPGDTGLAPVVNWEAGDGPVTLPLSWPFPENIPISHLVNIGYHDEVLMWADANLQGPNPIHTGSDQSDNMVTAKVDWLVCKESCIPGSANLSIDLSSLSIADNTRALKLFEYWQKRLPVPLELMSSDVQIKEDALFLTLYSKAPFVKSGSDVNVFFEELDVVMYGEPRKRLAANNVLMIEQPLNEYFRTLPQELNVVVAVNQNYAVSFSVDTSRVQ